MYIGLNYDEKTSLFVSSNEDLFQEEVLLAKVLDDCGLSHEEFCDEGNVTIYNRNMKKVYASYKHVLGTRFSFVKSIGILDHDYNYYDCTLSLHIAAIEASRKLRRWSDVNLFLSEMPPSVAAFAIYLQDGFYDTTPLHIAAVNAPSTTIELMIKLSPLSVRICDSNGWTPLHRAASNKNVDACELLAAAFPEALLLKNNLAFPVTPLDYAQGSFTGVESKKLQRAMFRGPITRLCSPQFHNIGDMAIDDAEYKTLANPLSLIFIEARYDCRIWLDVEKFVTELTTHENLYRAIFSHFAAQNGYIGDSNLQIISAAPATLKICIKYLCDGDMRGYQNFIQVQKQIKNIFGNLESKNIFKHLESVVLI